MPFRFPLSRRANTGLILAVLALFVALGYVRYADSMGDDLSASYIGCRLVASGDAVGHLYAYDRVDFAAVGPDDEWESTAAEGGFEGWLHPYVQTPLWAWSLQPLCTRLQFRPFARIFLVATLLTFAALLSFTVRAWATRLWTPWAVAAALVLLWSSTPFRYAMLLVQTHVLFVGLAVAAVALAERRRPLLAGTLLALAAAVKITPAVFAVYWLVTRRWRAAGAFAVVSAVLAGATVVATGRVLSASYVADLSRLSHLMLLSQNTQSLAATVMGPFYPRSEVRYFHMLPLPTGLRLGGTGLVVLSAVLGGWLDRTRRGTAAPLGALLVLIAATIFTPIAWTHYYIVLLPALLVVADEALRRRSRGLAAAMAAVIALNLWPLASDVVQTHMGRFAVLRGQFFSGLGCALVLAGLAWWPARASARAAGEG